MRRLPLILLAMVLITASCSRAARPGAVSHLIESNGAVAFATSDSANSGGAVTIAADTAAVVATDTSKVPTKVEAPAPAAPIATVVRASELNSAIVTRSDSLLAGGVGLKASEVGYYMDVQEARFRQIASDWLIVARAGDQVTLNLPGALSFAVGSSSLSSHAVAALGSVAKVMKEYSHTVISLRGHTDSLGDASVNQRISEQRALAVARAFIAAGVSPTRIIVAGYGASSPLQPNTTAEGRDANRRVEIAVRPIFTTSK